MLFKHQYSQNKCIRFDLKVFNSFAINYQKFIILVHLYFITKYSYYYKLNYLLFYGTFQTF